jgi:ring-1,2-phenylacetyl-CoA epoxidase subunit PaaA
MIETPEQLSEEYRQELIRTLTMTVDTELLGAALHYHNLYTDNVPAEHVAGLLALSQDELGHAAIACRLLEDLGVDTDAMIYTRPPERFKHPYAMDIICESFTESALTAFLYDRAGYKLLGDVYRTTSYAPWKRALAKIDREERFHIRFGERAVRILCETEEGKAEVQRTLDWMFPITMEFFGLPDHLKTHDRQIEYRIKSKTNDQLRQEWLAEAVPGLEKLGLKVPAHYDEALGEYVLDFPFPCKFYPEEKRWDFSQPTTWDEVLSRWKGKGPGNRRLVETIQSGRLQLQAMAGGEP